MKMSQWCRAVENSCIFSAGLKALSDRSSDHSAGGRRFHVADPLTAKLHCPVAVWAHGTNRLPVAPDRRCWRPSLRNVRFQMKIVSRQSLYCHKFLSLKGQRWSSRMQNAGIVFGYNSCADRAIYFKYRLHCSNSGFWCACCALHCCRCSRNMCCFLLEDCRLSK